MTRDETKRVLMVFEAAYQTFRLPDPDAGAEDPDAEARFVVGVWHKVLADVAYPHAERAAFEWVSSDQRFAPSPGQLRTRALDIAADWPLPDDAAHILRGYLTKTKPGDHVTIYHFPRGMRPVLAGIPDIGDRFAAAVEHGPDSDQALEILSDFRDAYAGEMTFALGERN